MSGRMLAGIVLALAWMSATAEVKVLHEERSLYHTILVTRDGNRICLQFTEKKKRRGQSCRDRRDPHRLVFDYARMAMASLLLVPEPQKILIAGLGGGTLPMAFADLLLDVEIDIVEIDEAVARVAREHFGFAEDERMRVTIGDARVFVKRAALRGDTYDLIILDAFNGDYIPEHLMTREFLLEVRSLMREHGVVMANTFSSSDLYDHESVTYREVFGPFYTLRVSSSLNRVIFAMTQPLPDKETMRQNAERWAAPLRRYRAPIKSYPARLTTAIDWDEAKRPLTDQYSPANLLRGRD